MSEEGNPYEEGWEEILEYCERCCKDCPPSEMCPGCDCDIYCRDEEEEYELDDMCGENSEPDPLCHEEDEWW